MTASRTIEIVAHPKGWLSFENLSIAMNDGSVIIENATAEVTPGERVLIMGASGSRKSTMREAARAISRRTVDRGAARTGVRAPTA